MGRACRTREEEDEEAEEEEEEWMSVGFNEEARKKEDTRSTYT
jgi:hypothetical protein